MCCRLIVRECFLMCGWSRWMGGGVRKMWKNETGIKCEERTKRGGGFLFADRMVNRPKTLLSPRPNKSAVMTFPLWLKVANRKCCVCRISTEQIGNKNWFVGFQFALTVCPNAISFAESTSFDFCQAAFGRKVYFYPLPAERSIISTYQIDVWDRGIISPY